MATKQTAASPKGRPRKIPLVAERLKIERKQVESGRVIVKTTTKRTPVVVDEVLDTDDVTVERVPIGELMDEPVTPHVTDDNVLVVPILEEVLVITRRLRLVEEIRIRQRTRARRHHETVQLRHQEAHVQRIPTDPTRGDSHSTGRGSRGE